MSTIAIIITALIIEYFFDDLKEYRKDSLLLKGFNYFENKIDKEKYSKNSICIVYALIILILAMGLISIADYLSHIIYFAVSLVIMLFCLRTNQFNRDIEELKIKLEFNK